MSDLERERERRAAIWAMTPADHLDRAIFSQSRGDLGDQTGRELIMIELLFALVKSQLGEPRFDNEGS